MGIVLLRGVCEPLRGHAQRTPAQKDEESRLHRVIGWSVPIRSGRSVVRVHPGPPFPCGSNPDTWVTECTGYIGNNFGPNGFSSGSSTRASRSKYPKS